MEKSQRVDRLMFRRGVKSTLAGAMLVVCIIHSSVCAVRTRTRPHVCSTRAVHVTEIH